MEDFKRACATTSGAALGQGLTEYALIIMFVAIVVIVVLALVGPPIGNVFSSVVASI